MMDRWWGWLSWKLPRRLVYFAAIRLMVEATTGKYSHQVVPELLAIDALHRWRWRRP